MATDYYHTVELIGPYEKVSKCKELLIQDMLCGNCEDHRARESELDEDDIWHLTYWFMTDGQVDHKVVTDLLYLLHNGVYPSLKVNWTSFDEYGDFPPQVIVIVSFPPAHWSETNRL
jgi:hypothetical protein